MLELAKWIYENYPGMKRMMPFWKFLSILDRYEDRIAVIEDENGKFKGAAIYVRLTDEVLNDILLGNLSMTSVEDMEEILAEEGKNIHFIRVIADGPRTILKGLKQVIAKENPDTVSWYKPDMDGIHFVYSRRELCHQ